MALYSDKYQNLRSSKQDYLGPDVTPKPVPSPIGGWDALSPLANMEPKYAVTLENWVPRPGWVELRGGYNAWCQYLASYAPVESLMVYRPAASSQRLFAAASTFIYEVTTNGVPAVEQSSLLGTARWQYENFTPAGGSSYLILCNGTNPTLEYDGTTWTTPTITGVSSSTFINLTSHQRRIWFVERDSTRLWYLATDAIAGAATIFDVGPLLTEGSFLASVDSWTVDGGNGPQSLLVVLSDRGQAVIYQGTDPDSASAFSLVGVFDLAPPIGNRSTCRIGSDLAIITLEGLVPLSKALPFNPAAQREVTFTNRIQNAMLQAALNGKNEFGWEVLPFPSQTLLIMNVPTAENSQQQQFVMNMITGAWCKFTGWNANCFAIFNDSLYFGDNDGNVNLAYTSNLDLSNPIVADMKCAFNFFESPGRVKAMSMAKPYLIADGIVTPTMGVDVDFADNSPTASVVTVSPAGGAWDSAIWDTATWSSGSVAFAFWQTVNALGTALALRMKVNYGGTATSANNLGVFDIGVYDSAVFDGTGSIVSSGVNIPVLQVAEFLTLIESGGPV